MHELAGILDMQTWTGKRTDWQPKAMITLHAVAVNTYLQDNEGKWPSTLNMIFERVKSGVYECSEVGWEVVLSEVLLPVKTIVKIC